MADAKSIKEVERNAFLPTMSSDKYPVTCDETGELVLTIGEKTFPLLTEASKMSIVQNGSANADPNKKGHAGELYVDILNTFAPQRTLLPVSIISRGFRYFEGSYSPGKQNNLICWSYDGITPSKYVANPLHECCSEVTTYKGKERLKTVCPHAVWGETKQRPACQQQLVLGFLDITDPDNPFPVELSLHGTALGAWNKFSREYERAKNIARLKRQSINDYHIVISLSDENMYYKPVFTFEYDENKPSSFLPLMLYYRDNLFNQPVDDVNFGEENVQNGDLSEPVTEVDDPFGSEDFTI